MANRALVVAGALLAVAGAAVAGFGTTRTGAMTGGMTPEASAAGASAVEKLDGDIKAAREKVKARAQTIADLQAVRAGVATDIKTVQQQVIDGALAFTLNQDEVIEIGQTLTGKSPQQLLILPGNAMRSAFAGKPGSYTELMSGKILVTEVQNVIPLGRQDELTGYVMISQPLDLGPALAKLDQAHVVGSLQIGDATRAVGTPVPGSTPKAMPLASAPNAQLIVQSPPMVRAGGDAMTFYGGGGGAAGLGVILLLVGLVTGKRSAGLGAGDGQPGVAPQNTLPGVGGGTQPPASQNPTPSRMSAAGATPPGFGTAATQMSSSMSAVTPNVTPSGITGGGIDPLGSTATGSLGPGAVIGRWQIQKRLGSGGMADVYLASARGEAGFAKQVAVKVMHPHLARNDRAVEHFLDEARLAAQISHPNVVQILDLGKIGNDYVIVMEYVDGVDLERLLSAARAAERPVPIDVGIGILARICDGLDAAHRASTADGQPMNLVHRDVKAANVLVSRQGAVKVVDFGIAKAASQSHLTVAGETKGTPSMMAPEQRVGDVVDVRADVYSVGAVAYEIMTGFNVNLDLATLAHLGIDNWPHLPMPTAQRPQLPPELDQIIIGSLAFDRERRPPSCAALGAALEAVAKRNGMAASDKDIAKWVAAELVRMAA